VPGHFPSSKTLPAVDCTDIARHDRRNDRFRSRHLADTCCGTPSKLGIHSCTERGGTYRLRELTAGDTIPCHGWGLDCVASSLVLVCRSTLGGCNSPRLIGMFHVSSCSSSGVPPGSCRIIPEPPAAAPAAECRRRPLSLAKPRRDPAVQAAADIQAGGFHRSVISRNEDISSSPPVAHHVCRRPS
jgi:hypothetical protein